MVPGFFAGDVIDQGHQMTNTFKPGDVVMAIVMGIDCGEFCIHDGNDDEGYALVRVGGTPSAWGISVRDLVRVTE